MHCCPPRSVVRNTLMWTFNESVLRVALGATRSVRCEHPSALRRIGGVLVWQRTFRPDVQLQWFNSRRKPEDRLWAGTRSSGRSARAGGGGFPCPRHEARDVAIKVLPVAFAQDKERVARFRRQAQVVASLNHQNVAAIYALDRRTAPGGRGGRPSLFSRAFPGPPISHCWRPVIRCAAMRDRLA